MSFRPAPICLDDGARKGRAPLTKIQREYVMTERQDYPAVTALVTGASRGFGRAVAAALAKEAGLGGRGGPRRRGPGQRA